MSDQPLAVIKHLEEDVASIKGAITGAKWIFGIATTVIVLLSGSWAWNLEHAVKKGVVENREASVKLSERTRDNEKSVQRYEAIAVEQRRRLDRIEDDIKEIKRGQGDVIRKLDQIILERAIRSPGNGGSGTER